MGKYDPTVKATGYMKMPNDTPLNPCSECGAEVNANWTIRELRGAIRSAEEIMLDAVRHLSRPQMGQDNNELAVRMDNWLTEFAG